MWCFQSKKAGLRLRRRKFGGSSPLMGVQGSPGVLQHCRSRGGVSSWRLDKTYLRAAAVPQRVTKNEHATKPHATLWHRMHAAGSESRSVMRSSSLKILTWPKLKFFTFQNRTAVGCQGSVWDCWSFCRFWLLWCAFIGFMIVPDHFPLTKSTNPLKPNQIKHVC